jgi:hypothetical protein
LVSSFPPGAPSVEAGSVEERSTTVPGRILQRSTGRSITRPP